MLELGQNEKKFHFEVGLFFAKLDFNKLITIGTLADEIARGAVKGGYPVDKISSFSGIADAEKEIRDNSEEECVTLFKSSRNSGLNSLVEKIYGE